MGWNVFTSDFSAHVFFTLLKYVKAEVGYLNKNLYKTTWQPVGLLFIDADNPASAELKAAIEQLAVESRNEDDAAMIFGWTNVYALHYLQSLYV